MSFDDTPITGITARRSGADLVLTWTTTAPAGSVFQVYAAGRLAWSGISRRCVLPYPSERTRFVIGVVDPADEAVDLSGDPGFPAAESDRIRLEWSGGSYLGDDLVAFAIYSGTSPGGPVSYSAPVGVVAATGAPDGFGVGGFGRGGFGRAEGRFRWVSRPVGAGSWNLAIRARRRNGLESTAATVSVTTTARPRPPAAFPEGDRVRIGTYNPATRVATVVFNASPLPVSPGGGLYNPGPIDP